MHFEEGNSRFAWRRHRPALLDLRAHRICTGVNQSCFSFPAYPAIMSRSMTMAHVHGIVFM